MRLRCYLLVVSVLGVFCSSTVLGADGRAIEITSSVAKCSRSAVLLAMTLKNLGRDAMTLYRSDLPWGIKSSMVLAVATNMPDPEFLKPALYIDDPGPDIVVINAAEAVSGAIDLLHRFPDLPKALQKRDLIVFWSYQTMLKDGVSTSRVSGSVVLEKARCNA